MTRIRFLYQTNSLLTVEDERDCKGESPEAKDLVTPAWLRNAVTKLAELEGGPLETSNTFWGEMVLSSDDLESLLAAMARAIEPINAPEKWKLAAIEAGARPGKAQPWEQLIRKIQNSQSAAARTEETALRFGPELPHSMSVEESRAVINEIQERLRQKGKLPPGMLTPSRWKQFINESRVNGELPTRLEHFRALSELAELNRQRIELRERWDRQMAPLGAPSGRALGSKPEEFCAQFIPLVQGALNWNEKTWQPLLHRLAEFGFRWNDFLDAQPPQSGLNGALLRIRDAVNGPLRDLFDARVRRLWKEETRAALRSQIERISAFQGGIPTALVEALRSMDARAYESVFERLEEINSKQKPARKRQGLLDLLRTVAPEWANAISRRQGVHGADAPPGDPAAAWKWRQITDELERRANLDERQLSDRLHRLKEEMGHITTKLVDRLAWASQLARTGNREKQALVGWVQTMRKIGKGTGKRVPELRRRARELLSTARQAVPVWIAPISRTVDSFDPLTTKFDVVIVDEASQSDVLGLVPLFLGKQVIVVGDDEQVSPSAVGQKLDVVQNLITTHLDGIPNSHLYDGQYSIYDVAHASFGSAIRLVEHFRCVPDIINFSNWLSYNGEIKPLRIPRSRHCGRASSNTTFQTARALRR